MNIEELDKKDGRFTMKIAEVRNIISQLRKEELQTIIAEMYKSMPNKLIESKQIDSLLKQPSYFIEAKKASVKTVVVPDADDVIGEAEEFIDYAYKQYYFAPNQFVHKKDRPKWRFIAKRLYRDLQKCAQSEDSRTDVAETLGKLYQMLCYACRYYLFSSTDPFQSMGVEQAEFLRNVIALKRKADRSEQWIPDVVRLLIGGDVDSQTLHTELMDVILEFTDNAPLKETLLEHCALLRKQIEDQYLAAMKLKSKRLDEYEFRSKFEKLSLLQLKCGIQLGEYDDAIQSFKEHYSKPYDEISLYVLLEWLEHYQLRDYWVREYQAAGNAGIVPRPGLVKKYESILPHSSGVLGLVE